MSIKTSELIINPNGSIYHLNLKPEDIAKTVIVVGDPNRVDLVAQYFDSIELKVQKREFHTQTGHYKGKRISVVSTGIGTDNIDIVLNELDALVNIDFNTRTIKERLTTLDIIRIGTSGSIQKHVPTDSFVISQQAIGFDSVLHYYKSTPILNTALSNALIKHIQWPNNNSTPYVVAADQSLIDKFHSSQTHLGITGTNVGFYGPQGRVLRLAIQDETLNNKLASFEFEGQTITNFEMESSAIYGLAKLLGHRALSLNAIIANRATGTFSEDTSKAIDNLIKYTLNKITE